ncbi:MAG: hypothetical protein ACE5DN_07140, partial [Flavobacteriales bacterium]
MAVFKDILSVLTKEEARYLKIYLKRTNASKSRKDILLFDLVKKMGDRYDEDSLQMLLYGHKDKNALYRLKNRLLDDIGKSLSLQYHNSIPSHTVMHSLELSRLFKERSNFDIALYYLKKAEKKASELQNFELLDIIYSDFIKLSHDSLLINPEQYIEKRKLNREQLNIIREIDDILAALIYRIRLSQNFSPQNYKIIEV